MLSEEEQKKKIRYMLHKQDEAYKEAPIGTFWERWIPGVCKHPLARCTHGDEIHGRRGYRRVCLFCNRSLPGSLPSICFFTGEPHKIDS